MFCAVGVSVCLTTNSSRADDNACVQYTLTAVNDMALSRRCCRGTRERVVCIFTSGFCLIFFVRPVIVDFHHNTTITKTTMIINTNNIISYIRVSGVHVRVYQTYVCVQFRSGPPGYLMIAEGPRILYDIFKLLTTRD